MAALYAGYVVTLDRDLSAESPEAQAIMAAIGMIKGVAAVQPVEADVLGHVYDARRDARWADALIRLATDGPG